MTVGRTDGMLVGLRERVLLVTGPSVFSSVPGPAAAAAVRLDAAAAVRLDADAAAAAATAAVRLDVACNQSMSEPCLQIGWRSLSAPFPMLPALGEK
jgi:hypothetical protein